MELQELQQQYIDKPYSIILSETKEVINDIDHLVAEGFPSRYEQYLDKEPVIAKVRSDIDRISYDFQIEPIRRLYEDSVYQETDTNYEVLESELANIQKQYEELRVTIAEERKSHNAQVKSANVIDNQEYNATLAKKQNLLLNIDTITDYAASFGVDLTKVSVSDLSDIDTDSLLKASNYAMTKANTIISGGVLQSIVNRVKGLDLGFKCAVLLGLVILLYSPLINLLAPILFGLIAYSQIKANDEIETLTLVACLLYSTVLEDRFYVPLDQNDILSEEVSDDEVEVDPRFEAIALAYDRYEQALQSTQDSEESSTRQCVASWQEASKSLQRIVDAQKEEITSLKQEAITKFNTYLKEFKEKKQQAYDAIVELGEYITQDTILSTKLTFGYDNRKVAQVVDFNGKPIIIRPTQDKAALSTFIQAIFVNFMSNVQPEKLDVVVYDPDGSGQSLAPFTAGYMKEHVDIRIKDLHSIFDEINNNKVDIYKLIGTSTMEEYNKACVEKGKLTQSYKLYFLLSGLSEDFDNKDGSSKNNFISIIQTAAAAGIYFVIVSPTISIPDSCVINNLWGCVTNPIKDKVNPDWVSRFIRVYDQGVKDRPTISLPWSRFMDIVFANKGKEWDANCDKDVFLWTGLQDADPDLPRYFTLGNSGNVHGLAAGATGSGKSAFLNHLIVTAATVYSPAELELWLADFKGVEFPMYLKAPDRDYLLPHIKTCLCTADGDFATSVYGKLKAVMNERQALISKPENYLEKINYNPKGEIPPNQKSVRDWNDYWKDKAKLENDKGYLDNVIPRILFINDEFQVIFQTATQKNIEQFKGDLAQIAKLGRALNVSMLFTSQSLEGTLSDDILNQMTLHYCLRAASSLSQQLLGNDKGAKIKQPFGWCYVSATGIAQDSQPFMQIPYLSNKELFEQVHHLYDKAHDEGYKEKSVVSYLESDTYDISYLDDVYSDPRYVEKMPDSGVIYLGMRMAYSDNQAPYNIILTPKNNEHVIAHFTYDTDYQRFFQTVMYNNQKNKNPAQILINAQVDDLAYICHAEDYLKKSAQPYLSSATDPATFLKVLTDLMVARVSSGNVSKPIYIFLMEWDKARGIGISPDSTLRAEFNNFLQLCGTANMHVFLMCTSIKKLPINVIEACNYHICGATDKDSSLTLLGEKSAGIPASSDEFKNGWFYILRQEVISRNKLYKVPIDRERGADEIIVEDA